VNIDLAAYLKLMGALALVLLLFTAAAWVAKRYLPGAGGRAGGRAGRRLSVVEVAVLDTRRRLVLVRRDGVEHLILLGTTSETVIERGIGLPPLPPSQNFADHLSPAGEPPR
jgi:flagellar protein FliO/FliZ